MIMVYIYYTNQIQPVLEIKPLAVTPMNQIRLGYTIETLADHPNEPILAGAYTRNPG